MDSISSRVKPKTQIVIHLLAASLHVALTSKFKGCLAQSQNNVSECRNMSTCGKSNLVCWSSTKWASLLSSHQKVICFCHGIVFGFVL